MDKKLKILFVGIPDMALVCLDALTNSKKEVVGIIAPPKDHACYGIMREKARLLNIPFITYSSIKESQLLKKVKKLNPDVGVVCSYDRLIPKKLLEVPRLGFINVHPSLLPQYRGANPYFHVIKNGETKSGVTIHFMDEAFDTGDIIAQAAMPVGEADTMGTLFNKLNVQASFMLVDVINSLEQGKQLPRIKQDKTTRFKSAKGIDPMKGDTVIDWSKSCIEIDRFIRACNPFFGTVSYFRGEPFRIYSANFQKKELSADLGSIVEVTSDSFGIALKDGVIYPKVVYFGSYALLDTPTFVRMFMPKEDEVVV